MTPTEVNRFARQVIDENRFDIAVEFLQAPTTRNGHAIWFIYKLSQCCRADQATAVSYLINEFIPEKTTPGSIELLRRHEFMMYQRLRLRHGLDRCLRRYVSLSSEGRALLRSVGDRGLAE